MKKRSKTMSKRKARKIHSSSVNGMLKEQKSPLADTAIELVEVYEAVERTYRKRAVPSEVEVFEAVLRWKQKRRPPLDETAVASTIRNLGMLRWLDVKPDATLRVPEEEAIPA